MSEARKSSLSMLTKASEENAPQEASQASDWHVRLSQAESMLSDRISPIVIKEVRQSLKSRQFGYTYSAMLMAVWGWSIFGVVMLLPSAYYLPAGKPLLAGYFLILLIPAVLIIPLAVHRSLAAETDDDTFELLSITALSARQIIGGKLASGFLQYLLLASILSPCFAFAYVLRGLELKTLSGILIMSTLGFALMTSIGLFLAAIVRGRMGQLLVLVAQILLSVILLWILIPIGTQWISGEFRGLFGGTEAYLTSAFTIGMIVLIILFSKFLLHVAAACLSPISENRSTPIRMSLIQFNAAFIYMVLLINWINASLDSFRIRGAVYETAFVFGMAATTLLWSFMGAFMLGESPHISPRVRRSLPRSIFGRLLLGWIQPGPMSGLVFAVTGIIANLSIFLFAAAIETKSISMSLLQTFALCFGYSVTALGITAVFTHLLRARVREGWVISTSIFSIIGFASAFIPYSLGAMASRGRAITYGPAQITNWVYTFSELMEYRLDQSVSSLIALVGFLVFLGCLPLAGMQLHLPTLALPDRMIQDDAAEKREDDAVDLS